MRRGGHAANGAREKDPGHFASRLSASEGRRRLYVDAIFDTASRAAKLMGQLLSFARRQALAGWWLERADR